MKAASVEELQEVPGVGPALAGTIRRQLAEGSGVGTDGARTPAVNMLTGEILDS
ncbi:MAG: hypothetical protein ACLGHS_00940 [Actinomycetes bacterium]